MPSFLNPFLRQREPQDEESAVDTIQGAVLAAVPGIIRPTIVEPCLSHAVEHDDIRILHWCKVSDERVKITTGHGSTGCVFMIHKPLIRHYSGYFQDALRSGSRRGSASIANDDTKAPTTDDTLMDSEFIFPDVDPEAFHRFVHWLYTCRACKKAADYEPGHRCPPPARGDPESWCKPDLERDYVLGDWLISRRYCAFVLSHFVAHVPDDFGLDGVRWLLEHTADGSPMHRFARHWVCWLRTRSVESGFLVDWASYPDLEALDGGWCASDPRKLAVGHWESATCGSSPPSSPENGVQCIHCVAKPPLYRVSSDLSPKMSRIKGLDSCGIPHHRRLWEKYEDPLRTAFGVCILIYHFLFPFAWVGIAAYVIFVDVDPLVFEAPKFYSLILGCCAIIGIWPICMRMVKLYFAVAFGLLILVASVLSFASSSTCLAGADSEVEVTICKMEIGVGVLQFFYAIIVGSSYKW